MARELVDPTLPSTSAKDAAEAMLACKGGLTLGYDG